MRVARTNNRRAFTLIELTVVMAIIVMLTLIAIPSLSGLTQSANAGAAQTMLRSLFASARATAANAQEYVGVRFQQDRFGKSYAVILRTAKSASETQNTDDPYINYSNGCPDYPTLTGGFTWGPYTNPYDFPNDGICNYLTFVASSSAVPIALPKGLELAAGDIDETSGDADLTTNVDKSTAFTIVFAPSGQIVRKRVFVGQKGYPKDPAWPNPPQRHDTVFNKLMNENPGDIPVQDIPLSDREDMLFLIPDWDIDCSDGNCDIEISQNSIWIYERQKRIDAGTAPFTGYVGTQGLHVQLNVYTGALIREQ